MYFAATLALPSILYAIYLYKAGLPLLLANSQRAAPLLALVGVTASRRPLAGGFVSVLQVLLLGSKRSIVGFGLPGSGAATLEDVCDDAMDTTLFTDETGACGVVFGVATGGKTGTAVPTVAVGCPPGLPELPPGRLPVVYV